MKGNYMIFVNEDNFDGVVMNSEKPVLFVIGASWCPDCQRIAPLLKLLSEENSEKMVFAYADFDTANGLKERFNVRTIPTLYLIKEGKVVDTLVEPKSINPVKDFVQMALES